MPRKSLLIVEDHADVRFAFQAVLNFDGYHVYVAEHGLDGVEAALEHRPDLILMDIDMPVMDGFEAAQTLKCYPETREIPIVAVTGKDFTEGDPRRFLFAGYVPKPVTASRLKETIRRLIGPP